MDGRRPLSQAGGGLRSILDKLWLMKPGSYQVDPGIGIKVFVCQRDVAGLVEEAFKRSIAGRAFQPERFFQKGAI